MLLVTRAAALQIIGTKESFSKQKGSTATGLIWDTNMATVSLFLGYQYGGSDVV